MIGFSWYTNIIDDRFHVPMTHGSLCGLRVTPNSWKGEVRSNVRNKRDLDGKGCEACLTEEVLIELAM
jgi:hypothetical protein